MPRLRSRAKFRTKKKQYRVWGSTQKTWYTFGEVKLCEVPRRRCLFALPHLLTYPLFYQWLRLFVLCMNSGTHPSMDSCQIPIYRLNEFGFIHDLWVEPEYRRTGIARQMVMLTISRCRQMGVKQIRLDTAAANDAARRLFSSCDFRQSIIEMLIELGG